MNIIRPIVSVWRHYASWPHDKNNWHSGQFLCRGFTLPYQLFTPNVTRPVPLIIHLHGSNEAGSDNWAQLYRGQRIGADYFACRKIQTIHPSFVLAPQTPQAIRWAGTSTASYDLSTTPSTPSMTALLSLIDVLLTHSPLIDNTRIYLTGLSRGGQGVWNAALQQPHRFAALVPIAGSASPAHADRIAGVPVWAFHGGRDEITDTTVTRAMITALRRCQGQPEQQIRYTEIPNGNHSSAWQHAYRDDQLYRWLLTHAIHR